MPDDTFEIRNLLTFSNCSRSLERASCSFKLLRTIVLVHLNLTQLNSIRRKKRCGDRATLRGFSNSRKSPSNFFPIAISSKRTIMSVIIHTLDLHYVTAHAHDRCFNLFESKNKKKDKLGFAISTDDVYDFLPRENVKTLCKCILHTVTRNNTNIN